MSKLTANICTALVICLFAAIPTALFFGTAGVLVDAGIFVFIILVLVVREKKERKKAALEEERLIRAEDQRRIIQQREKKELQAKFESERIEREKAEKLCAEQREASIEAKENFQAKLEAERLANENAAKLRAERRAEIMAGLEEKFRAEIEEIPSVDIVLSAEKYARRPVRDMPEVKFTNITKRTNPLSFITYVVVDVETTGLPLTSKIVEISAVRFEGYMPVEKFTTLINPERKIPEEATKINNITDEMVADAPKIWEVMPAFQKFVGSSPVVGHNLAFDLQFLYAYGFDLDNPKQRFYDTLQLAKTVLVRANNNYDNDYDVENYKLGTVCNYYGIFLSDAHRSCSDCLATGKLFEKLASIKMQ